MEHGGGELLVIFVQVDLVPTTVGGEATIKNTNYLVIVLLAVVRDGGFVKRNPHPISVSLGSD